MAIALAMAIGVAAGVLSGLLGVGGGILFVPALALLLGHSQVEAEATSLLAIIPVVLVGCTRQAHYGNVRLKEGALVGLLSVAGVLGGTLVANVLPNRVLQLAFAGLLVVTAAHIVRRALRSPEPEEAGRS